MTDLIHSFTLRNKIMCILVLLLLLLFLLIYQYISSIEITTACTLYLNPFMFFRFNTPTNIITPTLQVERVRVESRDPLLWRLDSLCRERGLLRGLCSR
jgi:hypothetical protein